MAGETNDGALWGARFRQGPSPAMQALSQSTHFDWRLVPYDLAATLAHARELGDKGFLSAGDVELVSAALSEIGRDYEAGTLVPAESDEDVHGALERILIDRIGVEAGGALRAGRSRNDQIATFVKLYMRDSAKHLKSLLLDTADTLLSRAGEAGDAVMPGRTHYPLAQQVLLAHYLLAHAWPLVRNISRIDDWAKRNNVSPYGGGALAGGGLGIDAEGIATELGFQGVMENSLDGTSSRDCVAEFLYITTQIGIDLSRVAEEIVILTSAEFGYISLHDSYATGSSMMPQKKNPDIAELTRGKTGSLIGNLTGLLATLKALPLAYNRDLQEDKEPVFDSVDTLLLVMPAMAGMIASMTLNYDRMESQAAKGFSLATDVADFLVEQGVPFRDAHEIVGRLVAHCESQGLELHEVSDEDLASVTSHLTPALRSVMSAEASVARKAGVGGTAPAQVARQRARVAELIEALDTD